MLPVSDQRSASTVPRLRHFHALCCLVLVVAVAAVYAPSLGAPFHFDDFESIVENATFRDLTSLQWLTPPAVRGETVSGRPVLNASFALNHAVGGLEVRGYRLTNVLIHALATLVLFGLVWRTLRLAGTQISGRGDLTGGCEPHTAQLVAFGVSLLWASHPLQTAAVTYVVQRAESLAAWFMLFSVYAFARAVECYARSEKSVDRPSTRISAAMGWLAVSFAACLLGIGTKETAAVTPLLVLLYDRTFISGSLRAALRLRWKYYLGLSGSWLVLGALVASNPNRGGSAGLAAGEGWWSYFLTQCEALVHYIRLAWWPTDQVFDYGTEWVHHLVEVWPQASALALLAVAGGVELYRNRPSGFLIATFFLLLAPSSSIVPVATQTMAEHRMYLPLALLILAAFRAAWLVPRVRSSVRSWGRRGRVLALASTVLLAGTLAWATVARNQVYASELSLWQDTVTKRPGNARAHHNLGLALAAAGRSAEAADAFRRAVALQPNHAFAQERLGDALLAEGRAEEALEHFHAALTADPGFTTARINLGRALAGLSRFDEAVAAYETALAHEPGAIEAETGLASLAHARGDATGAERLLRDVISRAPDWPAAYFQLGLALEQQQRSAEAEAALLRAITLQPDWPDAQLALGNILARRGETTGAERAYRAALQHNQRLAPAYFGLGNLHAQQREFPAAIAAFERALEIDPSHVQARTHLGNCLLVTGRPAEAIRVYQDVLAQRPGDDTARRNLELAQELLREARRSQR